LLSDDGVHVVVHGAERGIRGVRGIPRAAGENGPCARTSRATALTGIVATCDGDSGPRGARTHNLRIKRALRSTKRRVAGRASRSVPICLRWSAGVWVLLGHDLA
jgi:hypothetical protein